MPHFCMAVNLRAVWMHSCVTPICLSNALCCSDMLDKHTKSCSAVLGGCDTCAQASSSVALCITCWPGLP